MNTPRLFIVLAMAALLAACGHSAPGKQGAASGKAQQSGERKILYYRAPMNPSITSPVPQKDSMGMDYVPVYAGEGGGGNAIRIAPAVEENLGILTAPVVREDLHRLIHTVGYVDYDQIGRASCWERV